MKKVICPGEALIDFVSIDLGKSLKETSGFLKKAGGAPANVAAAISKLGADAYFCGTVGNDAFGNFLEDTFKNNKINTELMFKLDTNNTTFAFVSLMEDGERDFEFARDADSRLTFDMIKDNLKKFDLYHFGSATAFLEGDLKKTYYKLKEYAKKNNKIISFDFIKDSNIVKLSEEEAFLISGKNNIKEASEFIIKLGCDNLIITLGKEGALLTTKEKQVLVPTKELKMKDATGAGDAFMGAVLAQVVENPAKSMEEIVKTANIVGGITTTKIGALESIPTWDEVLTFIKNS